MARFQAGLPWPPLHPPRPEPGPGPAWHRRAAMAVCCPQPGPGPCPAQPRDRRIPRPVQHQPHIPGERRLVDPVQRHIHPVGHRRLPGAVVLRVITPTGGFTQAYVQSEQEPVTTGRLYTVACWVYSTAPGGLARARSTSTGSTPVTTICPRRRRPRPAGPRRDLDADQLHGSSTCLRRICGMCGSGNREPSVYGAAVPVRARRSDCPAVPVHAGRHRHCRRRYRIPVQTPAGWRTVPAPPVHLPPPARAPCPRR